MTLKEIQLKTSYETGVDDLIEEFYIPALSCAKRYDRVAGFFSSTSLALAARGIAGIIQKNGRMRLVTCPRLSDSDLDSIVNAIESPEVIISQRLVNDFSIVDDFQRDHVAALGWMLAKGYLEIKIALVYDGNKLVTSENALSKSIMHQKIGVLYDENFDSISFSGSNNESASGWLENVEEFKVFKKWVSGQSEYYDSDRERFDRFWENKHPSVQVLDLPIAIKEKLIESSSNFSIESISLQRYREHKKLNTIVTSVNEKRKLTPFFYQKEAMDKWISSGQSMLLEMATGCGKTVTAICCLEHLLRRQEHGVLTVIACPGNTLSQQWIANINEYDVPVDATLVCDGTNPKWSRELPRMIKQLSTGYYHNIVVFTTHITACSQRFIESIEETPSRISTFLIGDEVHGMGASKTKSGLLDRYEYRLGLSATPSRWFDDVGTSIINNFFGNCSYEFTIHQAQTIINPKNGKPFLVNYKYHPHFISLTENELEEYKKLSDRINRMRGGTDEEKQRRLEFLLFQRANIEKNAENKYTELNDILDEIGDDISDTIIFVSAEQIQHVMNILKERKILAHPFTEDESTNPMKAYGGLSEREHLIKLFKEGVYKVLVAIKCLDEGIDIPSARRAIVMASSTNPREYIQRIGRVIRQAEGKSQAEIYDLIIKPDISLFMNDHFKEMEKRIFNKEMARIRELSENAVNNVDVLNLIYKIQEELQ